MKQARFLSLFLSLVLLLPCTLLACSDYFQIPDYYNTDYTLTGEGLAFDWSRENVYDNGYKRLSADGTYHSYRYLLEQYFGDIDWGEDNPADVDAAVEIINARVKNAYAKYAGICFSMGETADLKLTITYPDAFAWFPVVIPMAETEARFRELHPNGVSFPSGWSQTHRFSEDDIGNRAAGVVPFAYNGAAYERILTFNTFSPYGNDHADKALAETISIQTEVPIYDVDADAYTFEDLEIELRLQTKSGQTAVIFYLKPQVTVQVK